MSVKTIKQILNNPIYANGSNKSDAKVIHEQKIKFNSRHSYQFNSIDMTLQRSFYGRMDTAQNLVYPDINKLIKLRANGQTMSDFVLPFVNDAYKEIELEIAKLIAYGKLTPNILIPFSPKDTFVNFYESYKNNINEILEVFYQHCFTTKILNNIITFKDFINEFLNYTMVANVSLTMSRYAIKKDITMTGLVIDTKKQKMDLDIIKEIFYDNEYFEIYNNLLLKYGFSYDKNAPWRLVFNVDSKIAKSYMNKYDIQNNSQLFDTYYIRTYETELSTLIELMLAYYNDKVCTLNPYSFNYETITTKDKTKTITKTRERQKILEEDIYKLIPEITFLKMYFYIRLREESFDLSQQEFDMLMNKLSILHIHHGVNAVNDFVNTYTKSFSANGANPKLSLTTRGVTDYNNLNVYFRV